MRLSLKGVGEKSDFVLFLFMPFILRNFGVESKQIFKISDRMRSEMGCTCARALKFLN